MLDRQRSLLLAALLSLVLGGVAVAQDQPSLDRQSIIRRIDSRIDERLAESEFKPADRAGDAEFIRRIYLDLTGVVPRVSEVRAFLADDSADKRENLIDRLLASPAHATHLANTWRRIMLPGGLDPEQVNNVVGVQNWLRGKFVENLRYDNLVSELLVATEGDETGPALYYTSLDLAPEKLAGSTARIFLGLQIECAECHDHPFDRWKQTDFWGYAAFFAQLNRDEGMRGRGVRIADASTGDVKLPNSETIVAPQYPGGAQPREDEIGTRRMKLAIWMASRDNPYLARAAVNRVWGQLFGRGLVEPVDDLAPHNPPSHPELFDELTQYFVDSGFDLRELYATLTRTSAYQRTGQWQGAPPPPELFARMALKTLSADQLYDSVNRVLNRQPALAPGSSPLVDPQRQAFIARVDSSGRSPLDYEAGVLRALTLLNGADIHEAADPQRSPLLGGVEAPWLSDEQRVETLFLATLSRMPTDEEQAACLAALKEQAPGDRGKQLGDVLWALLNSAEFALNH